MANFVIYNYQFARVVEPSEQYQLKYPDWENINLEESFSRKQEILGEYLDLDYRQTLQYINKRGWEYWHKQIVDPKDDVYVMRVANIRNLSITNEALKEEVVKDYRNCLVIIDNRPGIQKIAIEKKTKVFQKAQTVAGILEATFNAWLRKYRLKVVLDAPYPKHTFWKVTEEHPKGFRKILFHFPSLNLERLSKTMDQFITDARKDWESDLDIALNADEGGKLNLEKNIEEKQALVDGASGTGSWIIMYPKGEKKRIICGKGQYVVKVLDDKVFEKLVSDQILIPEMGTTPYDKVKLFMKNLPDVYE
ncbi:MAG: hypothetical protein GXY64_05060 [Bacteroidales bacterium]|nr:hypothetical protein [Bacteroidales bacterium]